MGLAQEAGDDRQREEKEQPRVVSDQRPREREQRERALGYRQQHRQKGDPSYSLPAGTLQVIVELRVLELREVQRVREQIAEEALDER